MHGMKHGTGSPEHEWAAEGSVQEPREGKGELLGGLGLAEVKLRPSP